jgi:hypothetical protein
MTDPFYVHDTGFRAIGLSAGAIVLLLPHLYYLSRRILEV